MKVTRKFARACLRFFFWWIQLIQAPWEADILQRSQNAFAQFSNIYARHTTAQRQQHGTSLLPSSIGERKASTKQLHATWDPFLPLPQSRTRPMLWVLNCNVMNSIFFNNLYEIPKWYLGLNILYPSLEKLSFNFISSICAISIENTRLNFFSLGTNARPTCRYL